ncbi:unnamed protein product [Medioppia subpectinata]|uniref:C2H2-type domain-containing protein n=1 Tax=Medioppia subpectinata TaxID=1979941 RepID=A0A7R9PUE5_9ACAR|nr:unnamed protein product [Medioppia subpectinata]CAG2101121.1 unnamed protein product [Medioppia subpectinata]
MNKKRRTTKRHKSVVKTEPKVLSEYLTQNKTESEKSVKSTTDSPKCAENEFQKCLETEDESYGPKKWYVCGYNGCERRFRRPGYLAKHRLLSGHSEDSETSMVECLRFKSSERMKCFDLTTNLFNCPLNDCHKSFSEEKQFYQHMCRHDLKPRFKCEYEGCDKIYTTRDSLATHLLIHKNVKSFKCHYKSCNYEAICQRYLNLHLVSHSTDRPLLECPVNGCKKTFKYSGGLDLHSRSHQSEPTFKCGFGCNEMFYKPYQRRKHETDVHNKRPITIYPAKKQRCDWPGCEYIGTYLNGHKRVHTGERPHRCLWPDCGKSYKNGERLKDHMNMHNNVRPYVCQWPGCEYTTTGASYLFNHKKIITANDIHIITASDFQLKSTSNDQQLRRRGSDDISGDMKTIIDINNEDMNAIEMSDQMRTQKRPKNKRQKSKKTINNLNEKSNECYLQKKRRTTKRQKSVVKTEPKVLSEYLTQNKTESEKSLNSTTNPSKCAKNKSQKNFKFENKSYKPIVSSNKSYVCGHKGCRRRFQRPGNLTKHRLSSGHTEDNEPSMTDCLRFNESERMKCFDLITNAYNCPLNDCHKSFKTVKLFSQHMFRHDLKPRFKCEYEGCDKVYVRPEGLAMHLLIHKNVKSFKCHYKGCNYEAVCQQYLKFHLSTHSTDRPLLQCPVNGCKKTFMGQKGLDLHLRTHQSEPTFKCGVDGCLEMFFTSTQKLNHKVAVHNKKPYKTKPPQKRRCDWPGCEYFGFALASHKRVHTGERPYPCLWPDCGKSYKSKLRLREHMNMHNNVRPYVCQWPGCEYTTTGSAYMFNHKKRRHSYPNITTSVTISKTTSSYGIFKINDKNLNQFKFNSIHCLLGDAFRITRVVLTDLMIAEKLTLWFANPE